MLEAKPLERAPQLVRLSDIDRKVATWLWIGDHRHDRPKSTATAVLIGRRIDEQSLEPCVKTSGIAQAR